jgi:hypothetical protein
MRGRYVISALIAVVVTAGACLVFAGWHGNGPFAALKVDEETRHQPEVVLTLGEGGDPLVVMIGFAWFEEGYCSGQFHVSATETPTEVRVGTVIGRILNRYGSCAGLGTSNNRAWAELRLETPLGNRRVVRDSDGAVLPIVDNVFK